MPYDDAEEGVGIVSNQYSRLVPAASPYTLPISVASLVCLAAIAILQVFSVGSGSSAAGLTPPPLLFDYCAAASPPPPLPPVPAKTAPPPTLFVGGLAAA